MKKLSCYLHEGIEPLLERWNDLLNHDNKSDEEIRELDNLSFSLACWANAMIKNNLLEAK